jgi:hypothetical protein
MFWVLIIYYPAMVGAITFDTKDMCETARSHAVSRPNVEAYCELRSLPPAPIVFRDWTPPADARPLKAH